MTFRHNRRGRRRLHGSSPTPRRALVVVTAALALAALGCQSQGSLPGKTAYRAAEWGDRYYPRSREDLAAAVERALASSSPTALGAARVSGILVPHAGYSFSANTLGRGFGALKGQDYERVVIVGESHRWPRRAIGRFGGAALPAEKGFALATGRLDNDDPSIERLARHRLFYRRARAFDGETSIEPLLPFVQALWPEARIVPILIGRVSPADIAEVGAAIREALDARTLLVISTTFTHFSARDRQFPIFADKERTLDSLREFEAPLMAGITARDPTAVRAVLDERGIFLCGARALLVGLTALGAAGDVLPVAEDWSLRDAPGPLDPERASGVSYRAILFAGTR